MSTASIWLYCPHCHWPYLDILPEPEECEALGYAVPKGDTGLALVPFSDCQNCKTRFWYEIDYDTGDIKYYGSLDDWKAQALLV